MLLLILSLIFIRPFICALAFPGLNQIYSLTALVLLAAYLIYRKNSFIRLSVLNYPLILFYLALGISLVYSRNRPNSLEQLYPYLIGMGLFLAAGSFSEKEAGLARQTLVLAGLLIGVLAVYQFIFGFKHLADYLSANRISTPFVLDYLQRKRAFFPFITPGALGGYLAMILPLALAGRNRFWPSLLILFALFLTQSFSAFLGLFTGLCVYFALREKLNRRNIFLLAGLFLLVMAVFICRSATQKEHLHPVFSALMRAGYWQDSLAIIKAHPFVGVGLGNFNLVNSRYAHNFYLQIWSEMGGIGLCAWIWLVLVVFRLALANLHRSPDKRPIAGLLAASAAFLTQNLLDFTFFLPEISLLWWVILGLALVAGKSLSDAQN